MVCSPRYFAARRRAGTPHVGLFVGAVLSTALIATNYTRGLVSLFTFVILLSTLSTLVPYVFCSLAVFLIGRPVAAPRRLVRRADDCRARLRIFSVGHRRRWSRSRLLGVPAALVRAAGLRVGQYANDGDCAVGNWSHYPASPQTSARRVRRSPKPLPGNGAISISPRPPDLTGGDR